MQTAKHCYIEPRCLLYFNEQKELCVNEQTAKLLVLQQEHMRNLAPLAVVGKYRTGKSFLLNRVLLGQSSGFKVGATVNSCTKGIWVWPEPIPVKCASGQTLNLLLMDTEGFGSFELNENMDAKLFLIASLLSSFVIYNSFGTIDEKALEGLNTVLNLYKKVQETQDEHEAPPYFLWLIRDFALRLQNKLGEPLSPCEYLEEALAAVQSKTETGNKKNRMRSQIKSCLPRRSCFTLIRPTEEERDLQNLSALDDSKLRPQFMELTGQLRSLVMGSLTAKTYGGSRLSSSALVEMTRKYACCINGDTVPRLAGSWASIVREENSRTQVARLIQLQSDLKQLLREKWQSFEQMAGALRSKVSESIALFESQCLGNCKREAVAHFEQSALRMGDEQVKGYLKERVYYAKERVSKIMDGEGRGMWDEIKSTIGDLPALLNNEGCSAVILHLVARLRSFFESKGEALRREDSKKQQQLQELRRLLRSKQAQLAELAAKHREKETKISQAIESEGRLKADYQALLQELQQARDEVAGLQEDRRFNNQQQQRLSQELEQRSRNCYNSVIVHPEHNQVVAEPQQAFNELHLGNCFLREKAALYEGQLEQQKRINSFILQALKRKTLDQHRVLQLQRKTIQLQDKNRQLQAQNERLKEEQEKQDQPLRLDFEFQAELQGELFALSLTDQDKTIRVLKSKEQISEYTAVLRTQGLADVPWQFVRGEPTVGMVDKLFRWLLGMRGVRQAGVSKLFFVQKNE